MYDKYKDREPEDDDEDYIDGTQDSEDDEDFSDLTSNLSDLDHLLEEGLEAPPPKRKMNPKSLENLKRGGINDNIKTNKLGDNKAEIEKRLALMKEDPHGYVKNSLMINFIKEEINLENLHETLANEKIKSEQQKLRTMIYSTQQTSLLIGDALKAQPKQNKEEIKQSAASIAESFEEWRKMQTVDVATDPVKLKEAMEKMRLESLKKITDGEAK